MAFGTGEWIGLGVGAVFVVFFIVLFIGAMFADWDVEPLFAVFVLLIGVIAGGLSLDSADNRQQAIDVAKDLTVQGYDVMTVDGGKDIATVRRGTCIIELGYRQYGDRYYIVIGDQIQSPSDLTCNAR